MSVAVALLSSPALLQATTKLPVHRHRSLLTWSLLRAFGIVDLCSLITATPATRDELLEAHDADYVDQLLRSSDDEEDEDEDESEVNERFGLTCDTARFAGLRDYVRLVAGASLRCARALIDGEARIVLCFDGGRHHAKRDCAAGFCWVNDAVLAILELRRKFERVLYIDVDVHHGDGVEEAFASLSSVFTLSLHHRANGFFPGTGDEAFVGTGRGVGFTKNVVLPRGTDNAAFLAAFEAALAPTLASFAPTALVMQCGCDGLRNDPLGAWNLSAGALVKCVRRVARLELPLLVLGGGGYDEVAAAKTFCRIAAVCLDVSLPNAIPECEFFERFGPAFVLRDSADDGSA